MKLFRSKLQAPVLPDRILTLLGLSPSRYGTWKLDERQHAILRAELGLGEMPEEEDVFAPRADVEPRLPHQQEAIDFGRTRDFRFGIFYDMGLGKTRIAIDILEETGTAERAVILAPKAMRFPWAEQFRHWSGREATVVAGNTRERRLECLERTGPWILNYESIQTWECLRCGARQGKDCCKGKRYSSRRRSWPFLERLAELEPTALVLDESTRIKNAAAPRTKLILKLAALIDGPVMPMSGKPNPDQPYDFWSQIRTFDERPLGFRWWTGMRSEYCVEQPLGNSGIRKIVGHKNLADLHQRLQGVAIRKTIDECVQLPDKIVTRVPVDLLPAERKAYEKMALSALDETGEGLNVLTKLMELQRITGGSAVRGHAGAKLEALRDLVEDATPPLIIWCRFTDELKAVATALGKSYRVRTFYGATPDRERTATLKAFDAGEVDILVGQPKAGGIGLNLQKSAWMCFYSHSFSLEELEQATARIYRTGQKCTTRVYHLAACKTIDTHVLDALDKKQDVSRAALDGWRDWVK